MSEPRPPTSNDVWNAMRHFNSEKSVFEYFATKTPLPSSVFTKNDISTLRVAFSATKTYAAFLETYFPGFTIDKLYRPQPATIKRKKRPNHSDFILLFIMLRSFQRNLFEFFHPRTFVFTIPTSIHMPLSIRNTLVQTFGSLSYSTIYRSMSKHSLIVDRSLQTMASAILSKKTAATVFAKKKAAVASAAAAARVTEASAAATKTTVATKAKATASYRDITVKFGIELEMHLWVCNTVFNEIDKKKYVDARDVINTCTSSSQAIKDWDASLDGTVGGGTWFYKSMHPSGAVYKFAPKGYTTVDHLELKTPVFDVSRSSFDKLRHTLDELLRCRQPRVKKCTFNNNGIVTAHSEKSSSHVHISCYDNVLGRHFPFSGDRAEKAALHMAWSMFEPQFMELVSLFRECNRWIKRLRYTADPTTIGKFATINVHKKYPTVEFRLTHGTNNPEELINFVKLYSSFVAEVHHRLRGGAPITPCKLQDFVSNSAYALHGHDMHAFIQTQKAMVQSFTRASRSSMAETARKLWNDGNRIYQPLPTRSSHLKDGFTIDIVTHVQRPDTRTLLLYQTNPTHRVTGYTGALAVSEDDSHLIVVRNTLETLDADIQHALANAPVGMLTVSDYVDIWLSTSIEVSEILLSANNVFHDDIVHLVPVWARCKMMHDSFPLPKWTIHATWNQTELTVMAKLCTCYMLESSFRAKYNVAITESTLAEFIAPSALECFGWGLHHVQVLIRRQHHLADRLSKMYDDELDVRLAGRWDDEVAKSSLRMRAIGTRKRVSTPTHQTIRWI